MKGRPMYLYLFRRFLDKRSAYIFVSVMVNQNSFNMYKAHILL